MKAVAIIPARYDSSRFPGKVLARLAGRTLLEHLYRRAAAVAGLERVIVATDDRRVHEAVTGFGGEAALFGGVFRNGSERVACLAGQLPGRVFLNIQADEPLMPPAVIEAVVEQFRFPGVFAATAAAPIESDRDWNDPNTVKVVTDRRGDALYFSRAPVPCAKHGNARPGGGLGLKHLGIYGFRRSLLRRYAALPPGRLEAREELEQLRLLENGLRMRVVVTPHDSICVDTPEDLDRLAAFMKESLP